MDMPPLIQTPIHNAHLLEDDIVQCRHSLNDTDLFTDERIIQIFESHPEEYLQIYTMGSDHGVLDDFRLGRRDKMDSEALLAAVKSGRLWFNIMGLDYFHSEYKGIFNQLFEELAEQNPAFKTFERSATLLVSSPKAKVYYHADGPPNILWHIRGRKKVYLYPLTETFAPQVDIEKIFTRESNDDLPYDSSFEESATEYILNPGEMISWPQNMPHRVDNLDEFCVSLSAEYFSYKSKRKQQLFLANHYLRRWLHLPCYGTQTTGPAAWAKRNAFKILSRLPLKRAQEAEDVFEFSMQDHQAN